ncbi:hypothetical protein SprV_0301315000 [Sparganum proliferum]
MNSSLRYSLLFLILCVLGSQAHIKKAVEAVKTAVTEVALIGAPPSECKGYIKKFLQWHTLITGNKSLSWVLQLNSTESCQKCYAPGDKLFENMKACMDCHDAFSSHLQHTPGCGKCLTGADTKSCYLCFLETKRVVQTTLCYLEGEAQMKVDKLSLYLKGLL